MNIHVPACFVLMVNEASVSAVGSGGKGRLGFISFGEILGISYNSQIPVCGLGPT